MSGPTARSIGWMCAPALVRGPDGSIRTLVGVCSDITARKTAEIERETLLAQLAAERTALAELTATLEQRVDQRTADLIKAVTAREKAQEQLRQAQKMETIGQLTGGVAHDFNNLLMAVMGNPLICCASACRTILACNRLVEGAMQGRRTRRIADPAAAGLRRASRICGRCRSICASDRRHGRPARAIAGAAAWSFGSIFPSGLPPARIDANQLELAILNLAINARDAMPDGGRIDIRWRSIAARAAMRRWFRASIWSCR